MPDLAEEALIAPEAEVALKLVVSLVPEAAFELAFELVPEAEAAFELAVQQYSSDPTLAAAFVPEGEPTVVLLHLQGEELTV